MFGRKRIRELELDLCILRGSVAVRDKLLKERASVEVALRTDLNNMQNALATCSKSLEDAAVKIAERDEQIKERAEIILELTDVALTDTNTIIRLQHSNRSMRGMLRSQRDRDTERTKLIKDLEISVNWNHQERKQLSATITELTQAVTATTAQAEHARGLFASVAETCKKLERTIALLVKSHRKIAPNVKELRDGDVVIDLINHGS